MMTGCIKEGAIPDGNTLKVIAIPKGIPPNGDIAFSCCIAK